MAGAKQDTRQKMIGMMYLVFIAMLALNISKEVLATLGLINDDVTNATADLFDDSSEKYVVFQNNSQNEYYKVAAQFTPEIKQQADDFYNYIENLKKYLLDSGNGFKKARKNRSTKEIDTIVDYQIMDKSKYLDDLFFNRGGYTDDGKDFVNKFSNFPGNLKKVLSEFLAADLEKDPPNDEKPEGEYVDFDFSFMDVLSLRFEYSENVLNREGKYQPYLDYHFKGFPLIASLSKLTKIKSDIRYLENKILENILSTVNAHEGGLNTYSTLLEASKSSYYTGELVDASVVMGKKDSNFRPDRLSLIHI